MVSKQNFTFRFKTGNFCTLAKSILKSFSPKKTVDHYHETLQKFEPVFVDGTVNCVL